MVHYSLKSRLDDGEIVEVNEHNLESFSAWIESRTGVDPFNEYEEALAKASVVTDDEEIITEQPVVTEENSETDKVEDTKTDQKALKSEAKSDSKPEVKVEEGTVALPIASDTATK